VSFGMLHHVVWYKFSEISVVLAASFLTVMCLIVEATYISEMSVNFYLSTWHRIPEDSHLHSCCIKKPEISLLNCLIVNNT
jgi:hypothetical protein